MKTSLNFDECCILSKSKYTKMIYKNVNKIYNIKFIS